VTGAVRPRPDEHHFASLSYTEVEALLAGPRTPVLLFPVGSTEPHGPHCPLATDPIVSLGMCERAARRLGPDPGVRALVLPAFSYGVTRYAGGFAGAVHLDEHVVEAVVAGVCRSLIGQGFRYLVVVNNHFEPEHVQALHRALDRVEAETGVGCGYLDLTRRERATRLTPEFRRGESHADRYETSLVLADRPELVDRELAAALPALPVSLPELIAGGLKDFRAMGLDRAYCGSPAEATAEEGEATFETLTDMLVEVVRALVAGTGGRDRPGLFGRV
jgi:creatinine amidohydrolase